MQAVWINLLSSKMLCFIIAMSLIGLLLIAIGLNLAPC